MRKRHGHFQISRFQNQPVSDQNSHRRIFSLPADAPCPAKRLPQNQVLRFSPFMQQKTHQVSADGSACKSLQDVNEKKGAGENNLSAMRSNNGDHPDENTETTGQPERMFHITREGGIVM